MSAASSSVRHRGGANLKKAPVPVTASQDNGPTGGVSALQKGSNNGHDNSEWDYQISLAVITIFAFITRFWGIGHPNEVVFDEVHFGKVKQHIS